MTTSVAPVAAPREGGQQLVPRAWRNMIERLHASLGGAAADTALIGVAALRVWEAAAQGHTCVGLQGILDDTGEAASPAGIDTRRLRNALASSPVVFDVAAIGAAVHLSQDRPLVLDGDDLYLQRLWLAETGLAQRVLAMDHAIAEVLPATSANESVEQAQWQVITAALAHRLTLVSGGPGTGKTTSIARLLRAFARASPGARIAIAAPTGKAAARLAESLHEQIGADPDATPHTLPGRGVTLHALLGVRGAGLARLARQQVLPFDLVVVDEASMIDLELAHRLLLAIGPATRLVLAGDHDQLASVAPGSVFAGLVAAASVRAPATLVRLRHNFRQHAAPGLSRLAQVVRDAAIADLPAALEAGAVQHAPDAGVITRWFLEQTLPSIRAVQASSGSAPGDSLQADQLLADLSRVRILCAMREGPLGAESLNARITRAIRLALGLSGEQPWYVGRLVIVTRNVARGGLSNGDVGVCVAGPRGLEVVFGGGAGQRRWPVGLLPECEDAWAMTVHKSQGSEYETVALVLAPTGHPLNTRELVYTGLTRARQSVQLFVQPGAIEAAVLTPTRRQGQLQARLQAGLSVGS